MAKNRKPEVTDPFSLMSSLMDFHDNELGIQVKRPEERAPVLPKNLSTASDAVLGQLLGRYAAQLEYLRSARNKRKVVRAAIKENLRRLRADRTIFHRDVRPERVHLAMVEDDDDVARARLDDANAVAQVNMLSDEIARMFASHSTVRDLIYMRGQGQKMDRKVRQTRVMGTPDGSTPGQRMIRKPSKMRPRVDSGVRIEEEEDFDIGEDPFEHDNE